MPKNQQVKKRADFIVIDDPYRPDSVTDERALQWWNKMFRERINRRSQTGKPIVVISKVKESNNDKT